MDDRTGGRGRDAVRSEAGHLLAGLGVRATIGNAAGHPGSWAASGAQSIAAAGTSPPTGNPAVLAAAAALCLETLTGVRVDGPALFAERAALMDLHTAGTVSAGGGTRLLPAADGWFALNLARDADLLPALLGVDAQSIAEDAWSRIARWARDREVPAIVERTTLLGMAAAGLNETPSPAGTPWRWTTRPATQPGRNRPLVVCLGALWAGPLAAHLLGLAGCRVLHVESTLRPDPTRTTAPAFFDLLHDGHDHRRIDFAELGRLRETVSSADVVIEASRPRALTALGIDADAVCADGRARTWLRITGHRDPTRVAFGDDAAVAGGLVGRFDGRPAFAGDAIADPLTGLLGALAISATLRTRRTTVFDLALADVAAYASEIPASDGAGGAVVPAHVADRRPHDMVAG
jgi:hypothetical protein